MSINTERSIIVKLASNSYAREEYACSEIVAPGNLLEPDGSGGIQLQSSADSAAAKMVALENVYNEGGTIDDAYVNGDNVQIGSFKSGDWIQIKSAIASYVDGDLLTPVGDGTVKKVATTEIPLLIVRETKTLAAVGFLTAQFL